MSVEHIAEKALTNSKNQTLSRTTTMIIKAGAVHACKICGRIAIKRSSRPSSNRVNLIHQCEYCGEIVNDENHVCKKKITRVNYVCSNCLRKKTRRGIFHIE